MIEDFKLTIFTRVKLASLLDDTPIDEVVSIYSLRGNKIGDLQIKIFWYDVDVTRDMRRKGTKLTEVSSLFLLELTMLKVWEEKLTQTICETLRNKRQTADSAFRILDSDGDGLISYDDFKAAVLGTLKLRLREDELSMYWGKLPLERNRMSEDDFMKKFGPFLQAARPQLQALEEEGQERHGLRQSLHQINEDMRRNTTNIIPDIPKGSLLLSNQ